MKAVKSLPADYRLLVTFDLAAHVWAGVGLNVAGLGMFLVFGALFLHFARRFHPQLTAGTLWAGDVQGVLIALLTVGLVILTHELVHGLFFWIVTRERPRFGFRWGYAYAAAPDWYLPRNPYLVVGLAPLILISAIGLALVPVLPPGVIPPTLFALTLNAAGAVGDLAVTGWLVTKPPSVLVKDEGDKFSIYAVTS